MHYEPIPIWTPTDIEAALVRDHPPELCLAVLSAALYGTDPVWSESICVRLAQHSDENVRGNAVLGFGHIARLHGRLTRSLVQPIIEQALADQSAYVRGHADSAADDVKTFLKW